MADRARKQIGVGSRVSVELVNANGTGEPYMFVLAPDEGADITADLISTESPLGQAVRGRFEGDVVPYAMGDVRSVRIIAVADAELTIDSDAAERRQAVLDEARRKAERTNAELFASSYSGKWGDYNTDEVDE